jgi:hypothetical protein
MDIGMTFWTVKYKDIGWSEVANRRQSTSETKVHVDKYVDKSIIARF